MKRINQSGFGLVIVLLAVILVLTAGAVVWKIDSVSEVANEQTRKQSNEEANEQGIKIPFSGTTVFVKQLPASWKYRTVEGLGVFFENESTQYRLTLLYSSGETGNGYAPTEQLGSVITADGITFTIHPYDDDPKNALMAFATTCKPRQCNYIVNKEYSFEINIDKMVNNQRQPLDLESPSEALGDAINLLSQISVKATQ